MRLRLRLAGVLHVDFPPVRLCSSEVVSILEGSTPAKTVFAEVEPLLTWLSSGEEASRRRTGSAGYGRQLAFLYGSHS